MTLGEFIRRNAVNADGVENLIRCWTQPGFGADPSELSFLYTLWYVACSGNEKNVGTFSRNSDTANGAQESRFVGGSQLIPLRLARKLGDIVALSAPSLLAECLPRWHRIDCRAIEADTVQLRSGVAEQHFSS